MDPFVVNEVSGALVKSLMLAGDSKTQVQKFSRV
jgi:hypothetical protein